MSIYDDLFDNQEEQTGSATVTPYERPYADNRGLLGDTASALGRGVLGLASKGSKAFEVVTGVETPVDEWAEKTRENVDFFKPDRDIYFGREGAISRGWQSAMESLVPSISGFAPGAIAGSMVGGVPGAVVGGILSTLGLFGAGTYGEAKEDALSQGLSEADAHSYALKQGFIEGGIEAGATGLELFTAGAGRVLTRPLTTTLKGMLKMPAKDIASAYAKTLGTETATEMLQAGLGAQVDIEYGMGETPVLEAVAESVIPSLFMSGIFVTGAQGYNARQRARLAKDLSSTNPEFRARAVDALAQNLQKQDPELANGFRRYATERIIKNEPISINLEFADMMSQLQTKEMERASQTSVDPLGPIDNLETVINSTLGTGPAVSYTEEGITEEEARRFEGQSVRYRRTKQGLHPIADLTEDYEGVRREFEQSQRVPQTPEVTDEEVQRMERESLDYRQRRNAPAEVTKESVRRPPPDIREEYDKLAPGKADGIVRSLTENPESVAEYRDLSIREIMDRHEMNSEEATQVKVAARALSVIEEEARVPTRDPSVVRREAEAETQAAQRRSGEVSETAQERREPTTDREARREQLKADRDRIQELEAKGRNLNDAEVRELTSIRADRELGINREKVSKAMAKQLYALPLTEEEQLILESIEQVRPETVPEGFVDVSRMRQEAYVSPEDTQVSPEEDLATEGTTERPMAISDDLAFGEDNQLTQVVQSPEEVLAAEETVPDETEAFIQRARETVEEAPMDQEMSESTRAFLEGDGRKLASLSNMRSRELPEGQGKAAAFEMLYEEALAEATSLGLGDQVRENYQTAKDTATYKASSRRGSRDEGLQWNKQGSIWDTTAPDGTSMIIDMQRQELTYRSPGGQWETVAGTSQADLLNKASSLTVTPETSVVTLESEGLPETLDTSPDSEETSFGDDISDALKEISQVQQMSSTVREVFNGGTREATGSEILEEIFNRTDVPELKAGLALIKRFTPKEVLDKLTFAPVSSYRGVPKRKGSFYQSNDHAVYYVPTASDKTVVHEMIHAITANNMRSLGENHPTVTRALEVYNAYKSWLPDNPTGAAAYAIINIDEFFAMALTNPEVQEDLKRIRLGDAKKGTTFKTLWDKFIDIVRNTLNLPKEYHSALEEMLFLTSEIAQVGKLQNTANLNPVVAEYITMGLTPKEAWDAASVFNDYSPNAEASIQQTKQWIEQAAAREAEGKSWFHEAGKKAIREIDKFLQPVSEVVGGISKVIQSKLLNMEGNINLFNKRYHDNIKGFVTKYNSLNDSDKRILDLYLMNSNNPEDAKVLQEIIRENGMESEWKDVQSVLDDIYKRYEEVGLNLFERIDRYFPRKVEDIKGLMAYLRESQAKRAGTELEAGTGIFSEILENNKLSEKEKELQIASLINTGFNPATALKIPTSAKSRSIQKVKADMMRFYKSPMDALVDTIYEANEAVETRKFVGLTAQKKLVDDLNRATRKWEKTGDPKWKNRMESLANQIKDIDSISDESISKVILNEGRNISEEDHAVLVSALRSRLNQKGMHGPTATLRNIGLITALGSPLNAVTQVGDLVWSLYQNGPVNTMNALFGKKEVTTKDLDMSHVLKEFAQGSTAKWLDRTLKWTGFSFMDQFGKNVNMQAAINKARGSSMESFVEQWGDSLTPETATKVWRDIQKGQVTDDVRHFVFNSVSKFQPVSLSEMPQMYLQSGNGRIFYSLKSYGIKALSNLRREIIGNFTSGNTKEGVKGLTTLLPLLVLANASVDELKDWILGRDDAFSDQVWDNLLKLGFASRYTIDKGFRSGSPVATFFKDVLAPPGIGTADPFLKDLYNLVNTEDPTYKSLASLPFFGKLAYSRTEEGKTKEADRQRSVLYAAIRDSVSDGNWNDVRKRINDYNRKQRKSGGDIIDNKTIRQLKARERKKLRE